MYISTYIHMYTCTHMCMYTYIYICMYLGAKGTSSKRDEEGWSPDGATHIAGLWINGVRQLPC